MNAKEYLKQIRKLDMMIGNKKLEIQQVRYYMGGNHAIGYEPKEGSSGTPNTKSPQETYICLLLEYEKQLNEDIQALIELKREAMGYIDKMKDANCIDVLYKRYFQFKQWEEIAVDMNYTYRNVLLIHGKALHQLDDIYGKDK